MDTHWQRAVVDWEILEKENSDAWKIIKNQVKAMNDKGMLSSDAMISGTIVYIVSVMHRMVDENSAFQVAMKNQILRTQVYAITWVPDLQQFVTMPLVALHPIVTEKDAIELNLKFPSLNI